MDVRHSHNTKQRYTYKAIRDEKRSNLSFKSENSQPSQTDAENDIMTANQGACILWSFWMFFCHKTKASKQKKTEQPPITREDTEMSIDLPPIKFSTNTHFASIKLICHTVHKPTVFKHKPNTRHIILLFLQKKTNSHYDTTDNVVSYIDNPFDEEEISLQGKSRLESANSMV